MDILGSSLGFPSDTGSHGVWRIPWTSWDPPFVSSQTQAPCCPEDPLDILGSSLGFPSDTGSHGVWRIPWTSWDPPLVFRQTQAPMVSGGSLGHPKILPWYPVRHRPPCCPEDPLDIPGSSLGVPSDTGPHAVRRISWTSRDPPSVSRQAQAPCCPEDPLDIPRSSVSRQTQAPKLSRGSLGHLGILPWCPLRHRFPSCLEVPLDIPGSQACQPLQFKILETTWGKHCMLHLLGGCGPSAIISGIILSL